MLPTMKTHQLWTFLRSTARFLVEKWRWNRRFGLRANTRVEHPYAHTRVGGAGGVEGSRALRIEPPVGNRRLFNKRGLL